MSLKFLPYIVTINPPHPEEQLNDNSNPVSDNLLDKPGPEYNSNQANVPNN